ncbi:hypothetical protein D3C72_855510 [compost metagenome]
MQRDLRLKTADPLDPRAGAVIRFSHQHQIPIATLLQMRKRHADSLRVVQPNHVAVQSVDLAIHQHQRHLPAQLVQFVTVMAKGVHDQPFDVVRAQQGQVLAFLLVIAVGVAHHQAVAVRSAGGFHPVHHGNRIRVTNIGHQHADQARTSAFQTTGHLVRAIAEFGNGLLDAQGNGIGEQGAIIANEARDAGLGHAGALGDVEHGYTAALGGGVDVHGGNFIFVG